MLALNVGSSECEIELFDSLYVSVLKNTWNTIINLFESSSTGIPVLKLVEMSKQEGVNRCVEGVNDCSVFANAAATTLAFGSDPVQLEQSCI